MSMGLNFNVARNIAAKDDGNDGGVGEDLTGGFGRAKRVELGT